MKKYIFVLLSFVISGCGTLPDPVFSPMPDSVFSPIEENLKVVTYNINWGFVNQDKIVRYLDSADADVIFLQETHRDWERYLKKYLNHRYRYSIFIESSGAGGIAFMSKYELVNINFIPSGGEGGWFPALKADIVSPIGLVQLLNVHLRPPLSDRGTVSLSALNNSSKVHRNELDYFLKETDPDMPLILAGDFNESENANALKDLIEKGFTDALSIYDRSSDTWEWKLFPGFTLGNRYDHIMFNKKLRCTGARVTYVNASDHMPVIAVFVR